MANTFLMALQNLGPPTPASQAPFLGPSCYPLTLENLATDISYAETVQICSGSLPLTVSRPYLTGEKHPLY
jgi:hypothetical protein